MPRARARLVGGLYELAQHLGHAARLAPTRWSRPRHPAPLADPAPSRPRDRRSRAPSGTCRRRCDRRRSRARAAGSMPSQSRTSSRAVLLSTPCGAMSSHAVQPTAYETWLQPDARDEVDEVLLVVPGRRRRRCGTPAAPPSSSNGTRCALARGSSPRGTRCRGAAPSASSTMYRASGRCSRSSVSTSVGSNVSMWKRSYCRSSASTRLRMTAPFEQTTNSGAMLEDAQDAAGALPAAPGRDHHLVARAVRVLDGLDDAGAERLVLEDDGAVDVEHDEQVLGRDRRVLGVARDLLDELRRPSAGLTTLTLPVAGRCASRHATGSSTSRPPRYGPQHLGHRHRAVGALVRLEHRDDPPGGREGAVEGRDVLRLAALVGREAVADVEPARLVGRAVRRRGELAVRALRRHPGLDVVLARRARAEVAGGDVDDAVAEAEVLQHPLLQRDEAQVLGLGVFGRRVDEHLELVELVHADDAAGVLAVRPGLAAVAGRPAGVALGGPSSGRGSRPCGSRRAAPRSCRRGRGRRLRGGRPRRRAGRGIRCRA